MLPHGTRWAASPRVTTQTMFATNPTVAIVRAAAQSEVRRKARYAKYPTIATM